MADAIIACEVQVVSRKQAMASGLTRYFMGSTCPQGHTAERYTRNGECVSCALDRYNLDPRVRTRLSEHQAKNRDKKNVQARVYAKLKRAKNLDAARAKERTYRMAKPELHAERQRRYIAANKDVVSDRKRVYRAANPDHEENRARVKAWRIANPDAYIAQLHLRRSRKLGAEGTYGPEDVKRMLHAQSGLCNGCSCEIWVKYTVDHMMPLSRGGSNWPNNLQLLCKRCNSSKNNRTMEEWLVIKERICLALQTKTSRSCLMTTVLWNSR